MAPALDSPNVGGQGAPGKRARRMIPIIPAIPRSLESKPRPETDLPVDGETKAISSTAESKIDRPDDSPEQATGEVQNEIADTVVREDSLEDDVEGGGRTPDDSSASVHQDFGIERHGFKLPPPFYPRQSPPATEFTDRPTSGTTDHADEIIQESLRDSPEVEKETLQQEQKNHQHSLRATALSFHAHPTLPSDISSSPTSPIRDSFNSAQSLSFPPQPMSPGNTVPFLPQFTHQGFDHAHSISFYPPPTLSSNDPSSPARSIYQGYAYGADPHESSPTAHTTSHSQSYQMPTNPYVSTVPGYSQQSPYYGNNPPFPIFGSQAPLTPSVTPLDAMPKQWRTPQKYATAPPQGLPLDDQIETLQPHYRSRSNSARQSDHYIGSSSDRLHPITNGDHTVDYYRATEVNTMQNARSGLSHEVRVVEHLLHHFNDPDYADCQLVMTHETERFARAEWSLISVLIAQSQKLRELLQTSEYANMGKKVLHLRLSDRFITPASMDFALRVAYGLPPDTLVASDPSGDSDRSALGSSPSQMTESLACAASGCLLQLKDVTLQGLQVASELLNWDSLEAALSFGLESEKESKSLSAIPAFSTLETHTSDPSSSSRTLFTPPSSSGFRDMQSNQPSSSGSSPKSFRQSPPQSAYDLLLHCLNFLAINFPTSWELDLSARPLADVDRLPVTPESRSPLCKSRLSRIQFGDHPSEATVKSADRNVLISTILFSLPFSNLDYLLESVGEPLSRHIGSVIKERERRRHIVLGSKSASWAERQAAVGHGWLEVGYKESVTPNDNGEMTISRRYTGVGQDLQNEDTPNR